MEYNNTINSKYMYFLTFSLIVLFIDFLLWSLMVKVNVIFDKYFSYEEPVLRNVSRCEHTLHRRLLSATRRECFQETERGN